MQAVGENRAENRLYVYELRIEHDKKERAPRNEFSVWFTNMRVNTKAC